MAVFTPVPEDKLRIFLENYDIGALLSHEGIEQGVSNTNYHVFTDRGRYVLTLFEPHRVNPDEIPFFIDYSDELARQGIACPATEKDRGGRNIGSLCGRPAAIFDYMSGQGGDRITLTRDTLRQVGALNARMHDVAAGMTGEQENHFGPARWEEWLRKMGAGMDRISPGLYNFCRREYDALMADWPEDLARGRIHADLFPDNVFFEAGKISGVIDFHFVSTDFFLYDLAITINAWCFDSANALNRDFYDAVLEGYESVRPLNENERKAMQLFLRAASLRFLLSRAEEYINHQPSNLMKPKDPLVFFDRLRFFQTFSDGR